MKEYYVPIQNSYEALILGTFETEEEAQNAYMEYLKLSCGTEEKFQIKMEKLGNEYRETFNKELTFEKMKKIIFFEEENTEEVEEENDWLMEKGIGCVIHYERAGKLLEFGIYSNWQNMEILWIVCNCILNSNNFCHF